MRLSPFDEMIALKARMADLETMIREMDGHSGRIEPADSLAHQLWLTHVTNLRCELEMVSAAYGRLHSTMRVHHQPIPEETTEQSQKESAIDRLIERKAELSKRFQEIAAELSGLKKDELLCTRGFSYRNLKERRNQLIDEQTAVMESLGRIKSYLKEQNVRRSTANSAGKKLIRAVYDSLIAQRPDDAIRILREHFDDLGITA